MHQVPGRHPIEIGMVPTDPPRREGGGPEGGSALLLPHSCRRSRLRHRLLSVLSSLYVYIHPKHAMSDQIDKGDSVSCVAALSTADSPHLAAAIAEDHMCRTDACRWKWGGGAPSGTVKDVKEEETTIKSKNNKDVRCLALAWNPHGPRKRWN